MTYYSYPVSGSPIIPFDILLLYVSVFLLIFVLIYTYFSLRGSDHPILKLRKTARIFLLLKIAVFVVVFFYSLNLFGIAPSVTRVAMQYDKLDLVKTDSKIEIIFSRPISRKELVKSIEPEIPGIWVFEDFVYKTHLARRVVFNPTFGFKPDTNYLVRLENIQNVSGVGETTFSEFHFSTERGEVLIPNNQVTQTDKNDLENIINRTIKLDVPAYLQQHALSCEVASLRMALAYRGINETEEKLLDEVGYDPTPHKGNVWGDPYKAFVGDVDGKQMTTGYGVYWGPIARVANNYRKAKDFEGRKVSDLTKELSDGNPVVIWVYSSGGIPTKWYTPEGKEIYATSGEHAVTAVGFVGSENDPTHIIVNDPLVGQVYWPRVLFDKKWATFGNSGVVVY